ncbi:hypothetical protein SAMN05444148_1765 [Winogradskyella jejuensis]|uniref:Uncharacterized protein n=1 Tax=Winogradskyella jejuensis TaxID=1089305 RepID=A0A1M5S3T1_9FLAO|nr:hypothetical protein SAMN05444148_1765 [Winogradskyella jejuensis]
MIKKNNRALEILICLCDGAIAWHDIQQYHLAHGQFV